MKRTQGFTLIELLVVIGILSMLFVVLLSQIGSSQAVADEFACQANLKNIYQAVTGYKARKQRYPDGGGTEFLWNLWKSMEPSDRNRDLFFCPEARQLNTRADLIQTPVQELWRTREEFTSDSTDYAARSAAFRKTMMQPTEALVADDNEGGGSNHRTGTVNVLYADGNIKPLMKDDLEKQGLWPIDDPDFYLIVGPDSPHPDLKKLEFK